MAFFLFVTAHGWCSSPASVVTAVLSNASWICISQGHGRIEMPLTLEQVATLSEILNHYAKVPPPSGSESKGPRIVPPSVAPDLRIDVRSKDGKRLLAFIRGNRKLEFIAFTVPTNGDYYDPDAQAFSVHDRQAIARFYAAVRQKR